MASLSRPDLAAVPRTATDFVGLAELRARAAQAQTAGRANGKAGGQAEVTREAARQFEALYVQMMLQSMRQASEAFGTGEDTTYRDMFDQQIALEMTRGKGLGLADVLVRQLAPGEAAGDGLREPTAADFVAARQAAAPSAPAPRIALGQPRHEALLAAASLPALELPPEPATTPGPWKDWRPATPEAFIRDIWPHAEAAGAKLGVDPRAIVAQAALETGWGRNVNRDERGASSHNLFNIKADARWSGERTSVRTLEFENGLPKPTVAAFRSYPDLASAFDDYVQFLKGNPRYSNALANGSRPERFADSLQSAGYATDPSYAGKLRSILSSARLNDVVGELKNLARVPTP
jgi:flagellar protein FlgJ